MGDVTIEMRGNLVNQLVNGHEKVKKKPKKHKTKILPEPSKPRNQVNEKQFRDDFEMLKGAQPDWPVQHPLFVPSNPPVQPANAELDAIRSVIQESEKVLENLQKQENNMVQEVTEKAKDLPDKEFKLPYQKPLPCLADYHACRTCFKDCSNDILKCTPFTRSYYDCIQLAKQQTSSADM